MRILLGIPVAFLPLAVFCFLTASTPVHGQSSAIHAVGPDGPEQMAVLYTHGFNDDGASWGVGDLNEQAGTIQFLSTYRTRYQDNTNTAIHLFAGYGIESYAVQWTAASPNVYSDPYATAASGFAFLADAAQLRRETDWVGGVMALHNRARPGFIEVLKTPNMNVVIPAYAPFEAALITLWNPLPVPSQIIQAGRRTFYLALTGKVNNYNDSGRVEEHAIDLLDLLRQERQAGGRLEDYRQVNIITHSKGSLVTRALLHKAEGASREDGGYVANVIYNAPPFAGCSLTELLKMVYDPPVFTRAQLANPWLAQSWTGIREGLIGGPQTPNPRMGDMVRALMQTLVAPFGINISALEDQAPLVKNNLDLLNVFTAEAFTLQQMATAPTGSAAAGVGNLISGLIQAFRPIVTAAAGIPAFPTASVDLTPQGGADFLRNYRNSSNAVQFVNIGTSAPFQHVVWPTAGMAAVAADPDLLTDPASQQGQVSDTYVAVPSAQLLTTTDAFGPRYKLGGFYDTDHGGIMDRFDLMATNWLSIFLAPPTTLELSGTVNAVSVAERIYAVSTDATFSFVSSNFVAEVQNVSLPIQAVHHEYRFLPRYTADPLPTPWEELTPGSSRLLAAALTAHGLENTTVDLQWRAVNLAGGREMIRTATIVPVGDPPVVANTEMLGFANEILKRERGRLDLGPVARSSYLEGLIHRAADLAALKSAPEPDWWIRNPGAKALVAIFDKRGSVDYAWNDPSLGSPARHTDVNALFLTLEDLTDGMNTLTFQPFTESGGIERRGPVQTIRVFVDNTPPEHSFTGLEVGAIGWRVGPATVLEYRAEDLESGGAQGTVSVLGFTNTTFNAGAPFRLGDTDIIDQIRAGPGGDELVGGFITFVAAATDRVGNLATTNFQAYFDFTAPILANLVIEGSLPTPVGVRVFTNEVVLEIDVREPNTSPYLPPAAAFQNLLTGEAAASGPFEYEQTVGAFARYTNSLTLFPGSNLVQVVCQDVYGNIATETLLVDYAQPPASDLAAIELLTPRIDHMNSLYFDEAGNATNFTSGAISGVAVSHDGQRFLFSSAGNGFVYGDSNGRSDVFLTEGGRITRVNTGPVGEQAHGGLSDSAAISGNGRYAYFRSGATNLVSGTENNNLYVKDIETGEIAVISRHFNGAPINRTAGTFDAAPTYNGRYVFFAAQNASYVEGLTDANTARDIYMVDLDPDGNGYFFDDNYVTVAISTANLRTTGNGESRAPSVSNDGRYLLFITQATDITPDLALNGNARDALLMKFSGNALDGTLDVSTRSMYVVNRSSVAGGSTLATGIEAASIAPDGDTVLFASRSNVQFSGDTNSEATGLDLYSSIGESFGTGSISNRVISWQSRGVGGAQSSVPINTPITRLMVTQDRRPAAFFNNKLSWVSIHTNLVPGDANGVADLFVATAGSPGVMAIDPPAPNWIGTDLVSSVAVTDGGLTPDGRSAWWVTTQTYTSPYAPGRSHLYARRIDPPATNTLTVDIVGRGAVTQSPAGSRRSDNATVHIDVDQVTLEAMPDLGWRFVNWEGVDTAIATEATVVLDGDRAVTATFAAATPPSVGSLRVRLDEDTVSEPFVPEITDPDRGDTHTLSIVTPPSHGRVIVDPAGFIYTPDPDYFGRDSFTYQVTDSYGLSLREPATAEITVNPVNDPPRVQSLVEITLGSGQRGPIVPAVFDPDPGDTFTFSIVTQPANGTAAATADGLFYTPDSGFEGVDSFTFRVTDSAGASDTGTVRIDVLPPPAIAGFNLDEAGLNLSVGELPPGVGYTVEFKNQIDDPEWLPVPGTQWPSTAQSFEDGIMMPERYYRLKFEFLSP
jgi:Tol biopolymer transport system component